MIGINDTNHGIHLIQRDLNQRKDLKRKQLKTKTADQVSRFDIE